MKHADSKKTLPSIKIVEEDANTVMANIPHENVLHMEGTVLNETI